MISIHYVGYDVTGKNYERISRPKGSGDYLFLFFLSSMHVMLENEIGLAAPGACFIFEPGKPQDYSAVRDFRLSYIHFHAPRSEMSRFKVPVGEIFYPKDPELVRQFIEQIYREYNTRDVQFEDQMDSLLRNMFVLMSRNADLREKERIGDPQLYKLFKEARYTMLTNCEREWASTNMPGMVSLSRSQFYKYYHEFFGLSPMQDVNLARIEKAKVLLTNENYKVTEVAQMVGYSSIHHFSRTFREHTGMSPLAYVKAVTSV